MQLLLKNMSITIFVLYFVKVNAQIIINLLGQCTCEELLYKNECDAMPSCEFSNNSCISKPCNNMYDRDTCSFNINCAWYNNRCSNFYSCPYYNLTNSTQCHQLHVECQYNPFTRVCERFDRAFQKSCSSTPQNECYLGSDGVCKYQNGQCSKLTSCESVLYNDTACLQAQPSCFANSGKKQCESIMGCQNAWWSDCVYSRVTIDDPSNVYLCQDSNIKGQCEDWNPNAYNKQNCLLESLGFYHWNGDSCQSCKGSDAAILLIVNIIAILIL